MAEYSDYWQRDKETMSDNEIREIQNEKLTQAVYEGYRATVIRDLWEEAGIEPGDVETVDDLEKAPVFRKSDIREYVAEGDPFGGRLKKPLSTLAERSSYVGTTSGTTGRPSNILVTEADREIASNWMARYLWSAGLRPGDVYVNVTPAREIVQDTFVEGAYKIGAISSRALLSPLDAGRVVHLAESLEPTVIFVLASPLIDEMQTYCEENDIDPREAFTSVKTAVFAGEPLVDGYRREIRDEFGFDLRELGGSIEPRWSATGCGEDFGWLHLPDDHFYAEVVDPETDERVGENERGELVITPLSYDGMAHIRWGSDDIGMLKRETCSCGRTGTKVNILGRKDDLLTVQGRKVLPFDVLEVVDTVTEMPGNFFQLYPDSVEKDVLRIRLGYDDELTTDVDDLSARIVQAVEDELGIDAEVVETMTEQELRDLGPTLKVPRIVSY